MVDYKLIGFFQLCEIKFVIYEVVLDNEIDEKKYSPYDNISCGEYFVMTSFIALSGWPVVGAWRYCLGL